MKRNRGETGIVLWSDLAKLMLREIHDYYKDVAGKKVAQRMLQGILEATGQISSHADSGPHEPFLRHLNLGHRYVVRGNYKVIYRKVNQGVLITDVFDTRQHPDKMNDPKRVKPLT